MRKRDIDKLKEALLKTRAKLLGDSESLQKMALDEKRSDSAGDLSAMPIHFADIGTDTYNQEVNLALIESGHDILEEINRALDRINDGIYGLCEKCSEKIVPQRLKALPYARFCINCQREEEESANS